MTQRDSPSVFGHDEAKANSPNNNSNNKTSYTFLTCHNIVNASSIKRGNETDEDESHKKQKAVEEREYISSYPTIGPPNPTIGPPNPSNKSNLVPRSARKQTIPVRLNNNTNSNNFSNNSNVNNNNNNNNNVNRNPHPNDRGMFPAAFSFQSTSPSVLPPTNFKRVQYVRGVAEDKARAPPPSITPSFSITPPPYIAPPQAQFKVTQPTTLWEPMPGLTIPQPAPSNVNKQQTSSKPMARTAHQTFQKAVANTPFQAVSVYSASLPTHSPEDSVDKIVDNVKYQEILYRSAIYTIRQLANATVEYIPDIATDLYLQLLRDAAKRIMTKSQVKAATHEPLTRETVWVYHYVGEAAYQMIKADSVLKSAFVLYSEYMDVPVEARALHPWVRVYRAYANDAAQWVKPKKRISQITDLDVYSFLVWRAAASFAAYDCTAGPKAIYFTFDAMPEDVRAACLAADAIIADDTKDESVADRYAHTIKINLSGVVNECQGRIYRVDPKNKNDWKQVTMEESICMKGRDDVWKDFGPGSAYFDTVPHGCIVTPLGLIPSRFLEFEAADAIDVESLNAIVDAADRLENNPNNAQIPHIPNTPEMLDTLGLPNNAYLAAHVDFVNDHGTQIDLCNNNNNENNNNNDNNVNDENLEEDQFWKKRIQRQKEEGDGNSNNNKNENNNNNNNNNNVNEEDLDVEQFYWAEYADRQRQKDEGNDVNTASKDENKGGKDNVNCVDMDFTLI